MLSDLVVCYLFLGGTGAGLCLVLSVLGLLVPRSCLSTPPGVHLHPSAAYRKLLGSGLVAAFVLLALGIVCLVADLGNAERMILLLVHPTASYLAVGSWALAACLALAAALGLAWLGVGVWNVALVRVVHVVAGLASLVVMVYTGLLLQSLGAVPLWATPWLPALFAASSLSCGIACAFLGAVFVETRRPITRPLARLALVDGVLLVLEALVMAGYLAWAFAGEGTALAAQALVAGDLRWAFWGGAVLCGLAVPFALERCLTHGNSRTQLLWIAAALLAGGFALRFCLVGAGAYDATQLPGLLFGLTIG